MPAPRIVTLLMPTWLYWPAGQRVVGEDLLLLPPLPGRDPDAADDAVLVVGHRPLDGGGVVDPVVGHRAVRR